MGITLSPIDGKTGISVTYYVSKQRKKNCHFNNLKEFGAYHAFRHSAYEDIALILIDDKDKNQVDKETLMFYWVKWKIYECFSYFLAIYDDIIAIEEDFSEIQTASFFDPESVMAKFETLFSRLASIEARGDFSDEDSLNLRMLRDIVDCTFCPKH